MFRYQQVDKSTSMIFSGSFGSNDVRSGRPRGPAKGRLAVPGGRSGVRGSMASAESVDIWSSGAESSA